MGAVFVHMSGQLHTVSRLHAKFALLPARVDLHKHCQVAAPMALDCVVELVCKLQVAKATSELLSCVSMLGDISASEAVHIGFAARQVQKGR